MERQSDTSFIDTAILNEIDEIDASSQQNSSEDDEKLDKENKWQVEITELPRQFKKPWIDYIDRRFIISIIASLLIHIILFYLAPYFISNESEQTVIKKMHERFVNSLLHENERLGSSGQVVGGEIFGAVDQKAQKDLSQMIEEIILGIVHSGGDDALDLSPLTDKILTPDMIKEMKKSFGKAEDEKNKARDRSQRLDEARKEIHEKIRDVGLLGIVTNGIGYSEYEYIVDILDNANRKAENLDNVLKEINSLKVPRFKRPTAWRDPNDVSVGLKTGRKTEKDQNEFYASVAPLAKVEQIPIARNVDLDVLGSPLAGLNRKKAANGKFRSFKHISKVVSSHKKAIQDCYKQVLKNQPNLKGRMEVRFDIDPSGKVVSAEITSSTINHPKIERCVLNRIRRWNDFGPCDPKLGTMTFKIPYNFGIE